MVQIQVATKQANLLQIAKMQEKIKMQVMLLMQAMHLMQIMQVIVQTQITNLKMQTTALTADNFVVCDNE